MAFMKENGFQASWILAILATPHGVQIDQEGTGTNAYNGGEQAASWKQEEEGGGRKGEGEFGSGW